MIKSNDPKIHTAALRLVAERGVSQTSTVFAVEYERARAEVVATGNRSAAAPASVAPASVGSSERSDKEKHFTVLRALAAQGITERDPSYAQQYDRLSVAVDKLNETMAAVAQKRQNATVSKPARQAAKPASAPPRTAVAMVRPFVVATQPARSTSHVVKLSERSEKGSDLAEVVGVLRSIRSVPITEQQKSAYEAFGRFSPEHMTGGRALIYAIADLHNKRDKAAAVANIQRAADAILDGPEAA